MRTQRVYHAVNSHTEGMPTRVITGGVGTLPGATMLERKLAFERDRDDLRTLLMFEPRGHGAMSGAILQPPTHPDADVGVLFIEVSGCLAMCGHGTIGVCTVLVETGMVEVEEPVTTIRLDTPAGLVTARVEVRDGRAESVTLTNVPSFLLAADEDVETDELGTVRYDMAYGGNFYAILPAARLGLDLGPTTAPDLIRRGLHLMAAINAQRPPVHPELPDIRGCRHIILTGDASPDADGRSAVVIHPGWIDRSPCGTGTSARMAALHASGALPLQQDYVHESLIRSRFTGRLVDETSIGGIPAVIPTIRGRAWITGLAQYMLDPTDPYPAGFLIGAASDAAAPTVPPAPPALGSSS
jgi:proline racemase